MGWSIPGAADRLPARLDPLGLILTRIAGLGDIRDIGSANRCNQRAAHRAQGHCRSHAVARCTQRDCSRPHWLAVRLARALAAAPGAYAGHCFPVWLKVQGRQGVRDISWRPPRAPLANNVPHCACLARGRSSDPLFVAFGAHGEHCCAGHPALFGHIEMAELAVVLTILIWIKHRANLQRLLAGENSRIGAK